MGQAIDRQFQALTSIFNFGGVQVFIKFIINQRPKFLNNWNWLLNLYILKGLIATAITTAPTVIPAATLTLGGVNYFNNVNQQNVLDEQQSSLDSLSTRLSSAESSISSSSSATGKMVLFGKSIIVSLF